MNYNNNLDLTIGDEGKRKFKINGNKVIHKCLVCKGEITCWEQDTLFLCSNPKHPIPVIIPYTSNK